MFGAALGERDSAVRVEFVGCKQDQVHRDSLDARTEPEKPTRDESDLDLVVEFGFVAGEAAQIKGEWGLKDEFNGVSWTAVKQRNMTPDPNSVMPDETQKAEGGGWDESKKKSGGDGDKGGGDEWN